MTEDNNNNTISCTNYFDYFLINLIELVGNNKNLDLTVSNIKT